MTIEQEYKIVDAYSRLGTYSKVREKLGHSSSTIWKVVTKYGLNKGIGGNQTAQTKITDAELMRAVKTMTTKEIVQHYKIHETNVLRRCRKLGIKPLGSGDQLSGLRKNWGKHNENLKSFGYISAECWHYVSSQDDMIKTKHPDFLYLETQKKRIRLKCRTCGLIIERASSTIRTKNIRCDYCEAQRKQQKELTDKRIELIRIFYAIKQKRTPQICECCGEDFFSEYKKRYCSEKCKEKQKRIRYRERHPEKIKENKKIYRSHHITRAKKYGVPYEYGITLKKVIQKNRNICQICGKPCDITDIKETYVGALYPSIDHIMPLSKGGGHLWDNVQLAHMICNSYKRDLYTVKNGG